MVAALTHESPSFCFLSGKENGTEATQKPLNLVKSHNRENRKHEVMVKQEFQKKSIFTSVEMLAKSSTTEESRVVSESKIKGECAVSDAEEKLWNLKGRAHQSSGTVQWSSDTSDRDYNNNNATAVDLNSTSLAFFTSACSSPPSSPQSPSLMDLVQTPSLCQSQQEKAFLQQQTSKQQQKLNKFVKKISSQYQKFSNFDDTDQSTFKGD